MTIRFAQQGNRFFIAPPEYPTIEQVPVGTYSLGFDPENIPGGFYFSRIDDFTLPKKIYGHNSTYAQTILETFQERQGVITTAALSGQKGSGKTLTAQEISILGAQLGIPTVEISIPFAGPGFNQFLQKIRQAMIIFVDEFEKVYKDEDDRNRLLGLLDGPYKTHKLFLFTMNKPLDNGNFEYFFNRPGRVYYNIPYGAVSEEIIREFCADHLIDQSRLVDVISFSKRFTYFTLDMLTILIKEINKTGLSCSEISAIVNIKPDLAPSELMFEVEVIGPDGKPVQTVATEYSWKEQPHAAVVPYDLPRSILQGGSRSIRIPVYTKDDHNTFRTLYREDQTNYIDFDSYFDEDYELEVVDKDDKDDVDNLKKRQLHYKDAHRGVVSFNFSLDSTYINHSQDPETRAVTVANTLAGYTLVISPLGKKERPLRYTF